MAQTITNTKGDGTSHGDFDQLAFSSAFDTGTYETISGALLLPVNCALASDGNLTPVTGSALEFLRRKYL